jgi:carbon-monoxide dehydrogenase medium subunit
MIVETDQHTHIGSRVTHTQALNSPRLQQICPSLVDACRQVGGPPIRNRGTLAGNVANASPAADSALPLLAHDAQVVAVRYGGERVIPLVDFYLGPGKNCLAEDEFIREIKIPKKVLHTKSVFLKLGNRQAMAIAVASVAVMVSLDETGRVGEARIALGSVAPIPLRAIRAEAILQSNLLNEATIRITAEAAKQEATPISDLRASADYRSRMVAVLVRRALGMILKDIHLGEAYD